MWERDSCRRQGARMVAIAMILAGACGDDERQSVPCSVEAQSGCADGQVCEVVEGGATACFAPVLVVGRVVDALTPTLGIEGARVVALDVNGAVASHAVAVTDDDGSYALPFPAVRAADGTPTLNGFSLRADAEGYATFPGGLRTALPVDVTMPTVTTDGSYEVQNATTTIGLDALGSRGTTGTISGMVDADGAVGTLVVAGGRSAIVAPDGTFVIFNVSVGSHEVRGYKQGLQLESTTVAVSANSTTADVELRASDAALASVSGSVQFVNAGSNVTSVILAVKSTFNETLARGEVPFGLRAADVRGAWSIEGVPAGDYLVLAAFENDGLVRDPDAAIAGTELQEITVTSAPVAAGSFKITGALEVLSPGASAPEVVTGVPVFRWVDDSSEDGYDVSVYNTFGVVVWHQPDSPRVTGGNVSVTYAGPALEPGYYQFRALSWRNSQQLGRTYISATEDLKGVFIIDQ